MSPYGGNNHEPAVFPSAPPAISGLNSIYEQEYEKQRTDNAWGCLDRPSWGSGDDVKGDASSKTKRKGPPLILLLLSATTPRGWVQAPPSAVTCPSLLICLFVDAVEAIHRGLLRAQDWGAEQCGTQSYAVTVSIIRIIGRSPRGLLPAGTFCFYEVPLTSLFSPRASFY